MRPKLVIGGSPPCRGASVTSAQMDREACNAEVRAVKAIPLDTRSPLSILWICAPEACLLVGFDWPRTDSCIRYSSQLFTAPTSIMLVPGSARLKLHSYSDHLRDFGCATLGKSLALLFGEVHAQFHQLGRRFLAFKGFAIPDKLGEKDQQGQLWTLRCAFARYYTIA